MKTIKIIQGVFGYVAAPGKAVAQKTPADPAFPVDDELAVRLVEKRVAVYADAVTDVDQPDDEEYSTKMTRDQLNAIAASYGAENPAKIKGGKEAVIEAIEAAKAASEGDEEDLDDEDTEEGGEGDDGNDEPEADPPVLGAADPV